MAASLSEQENLVLPNDMLAAPHRGLAGCGATAATPPPFRFSTPRQLIDWRALHALDLAAVVRDTDIDALESVLDIVAHGDMDGEDARHLTPANAARAFRVAQLAVDYLLHVQDRLATDAFSAKGELSKLQRREQLLQLKVRELQEELAGSRKEVRHLKKAAKTLEALALARQAAPPPPPEQRVVERVVEVPDAAAARRAERLDAEVAQLEAERLELQRDNRKLKSAFDALQQSAATAADNVRREERQAAQQQLQAAVEEEKRKHSKAKLSVVVSGEESPTHQGRLATALRRAEAAEAELARAAATAGKAAAAPAAELRRLRAALEASQAEADMLHSRLSAADRGHSASRMSSRQPGHGLGGELEDAADEARLQQLEAQADALQAQLSSSQAACTQLAARCAQLEQQQRDGWQQGGAVLPTAAATVGTLQDAAEGQAARMEAARLREEKAALKEECRRLRQEAAGHAVEVEHLTLRLRQLADGRGGTSGRGQPVPQVAVPDHGSAERCSAGGAERLAAAMGDARHTGSPMHQTTASAAGAAAEARLSSPRDAARQRGTHVPGDPGAPAAARRVAVSPTEGDKAAFRREMQHTLHTAERPGVVSRFPHSLGSFLALRGELQSELEAELADELASYGIDPDSQGLSDSQLADAMAELERRRAEVRQNMSEADRKRADYMRSTVGWHVQQMAELASGQRAASPVKQVMLAQPPISLKPIRTYSGDGTASPSPRHSPKGFVHEVLEHVGDEAAVYSPLARGASVLSDRGYFEDNGLGSPNSSSSPVKPLLSTDGGCTPRSTASSPTRHPRAMRSVQFGGGPLATHQQRGGEEEAVAVQRVGRRPSFTQQQASAAAAQLAASSVVVPGGRRVLREAESIAAKQGPWEEALADLGTGGAPATRPAVRRLPRD